MQKLTRKAITGLIWLQIVMAVLLFAPAWTLHFWEAWTFWLLFSVLSAFVTFYFLKHDPGLVEIGSRSARPPNTRRARKSCKR
jgi:hypothetical protein